MSPRRWSMVLGPREIFSVLTCVKRSLASAKFYLFVRDSCCFLLSSCTFNSFSRRDPYLAAQLEATKRDSMRSLRSDEQRRFEKLGYDSGGAGRSRTTERKRPSAGSTGSRRSSSKESAPPRRSDSDERRTGDRARPVVTRASSARQLKVKGEGGGS